VIVFKTFQLAFYKALWLHHTCNWHTFNSGIFYSGAGKLSPGTRLVQYHMQTASTCTSTGIPHHNIWKVKEITAVTHLGKWQEQLAEGLRTAVKKTANRVYNLVANLLVSLCLILGFQLHPPVVNLNFNCKFLTSTHYWWKTCSYKSIRRFLCHQDPASGSVSLLDT